MGFGRSGDRVLNTPVIGLRGSPRGIVSPSSRITCHTECMRRIQRRHKSMRNAYPGSAAPSLRSNSSSLFANARSRPASAAGTIPAAISQSSGPMVAARAVRTAYPTVSRICMEFTFDNPLL